MAISLLQYQISFSIINQIAEIERRQPAAQLDL